MTLKEFKASSAYRQLTVAEKRFLTHRWFSKEERDRAQVAAIRERAIKKSQVVVKQP